MNKFLSGKIDGRDVTCVTCLNSFSKSFRSVIVIFFFWSKRRIKINRQIFFGRENRIKRENPNVYNRTYKIRIISIVKSFRDLNGIHLPNFIE